MRAQRRDALLSRREEKVSCRENPAVSDEDQSLFGTPGRTPSRLVALELQDQFNRRSKALETFLSRPALAIGFRYVGTARDEPFPVALNNGRVAVSHERTIYNSTPTGNFSLSLASLSPP